MIFEEDYDENFKLCVDILIEYTKDKVGDIVEDDDKKVSLVYKENEKVLGRLVGNLIFKSLHIELLAIEKEYRNKGIGGKLLIAAEKIANDKNCHFIHLETMSFNAPRFYLAHGYEIMKKIENSPIKGEDHYFFIKFLNK